MSFLISCHKMFGAGGGAEESTPKAISNGSVILEQPTGSDVQEISKPQEKNEVLEKDPLTEESETLVDITVSGLDYFPYPSLRHIGDDVDDICVNHEHILYGQAFSTLDELRRDGLLCDVELSVGDHRTIAAHRVVLAAVIPYFHAMFTVDMVESTKKKVTIRNIDFATLELIVSYAYCGRLHINVENVLPVMYAANFLQLNALTEKCANYLKHHMHLSNVLGVRAVCSSLNCSSEETERFVEKYFTSICLTKSFLELSIDELTMLLAKNSLNVENEETVCKAALRWIDHDPTHRKVYISRILKCLRLLALNPSFLVVDLGRHPLVREDKQSRDILDEVKDYLLVPNLERSSQPPFSAEPRHCRDLPCLIYAIGGASSDAEGTVLSKSEVYDPARRKWSQAEPLLTIRKEFGTAVLDGKIYVFGGHAEPENILNTVDTYDYVPNVWVSVTPMPTARFSVSVAAINNKLYVCGGENGAMLGIVEVFCPENNCWEAGAPMLTPRSRAAIAVLGGCLYLIGGHDGNSVLSSVDRFSPETQQWERIAPMRSQRELCAATTLNDKIFVCGGSNGSECLNTVECYDPTLNRWFSIAPMKVARKGLSVVAYDNVIYAISGENDSTTLCSMEVYREDADEWEFSAYLQTGRKEFGAAVVPVSIDQLSKM